MPGTADSLMTIDEYLGWLAPVIWQQPGQDDQWLMSPADVFGIAVSLLRRSGAYRQVAEQWPPSKGGLANWIQEVTSLAAKWRTAINQGNARRMPKEIPMWWRTIRRVASLSVQDVPTASQLGESLLQLAAVADQAFSDLLDRPSDQFGVTATAHLELNANLCQHVDSSRFRVLPKAKPPRYGLTHRSISQYLALCQGIEVRTKWYRLSTSAFRRSGSVNVLLVPLPYEINIGQFNACVIPNAEMPPEFGHFQYVPDTISSDALGEWVAALLKHAQGERGGPIHVAVFPECALREQDYDAVVRSVRQEGLDTILVCGVSGSSETAPWHINEARLNIPWPRGVEVTAVQRKHHRWMLNARQIASYDGLASQLPCSGHPCMYWEAIRLFEREIQFVQLEGWFSICVLICEDLTRVDPVGDLLRAVAPDLVIALLQDGAQVEQRWPGKYAATLAEDPGSSVITLSSAGMVELSARAFAGSASRSPSRSIALWKEDDLRGAIPIELRGSDAVLLPLEMTNKTHYSADGRQQAARVLQMAPSGPMLITCPDRRAF